MTTFPFTLRHWAISLCATALLSPGALVAQPQNADNGTLVVASFGGQLDNVYREVFRDFEATHNVRIRWVPGTAPGNVAKLTATKANPEYDLLLSDNINQRVASTAGLLTPIDPALVPQWADIPAKARAAGNDGTAIGIFVTGLYYREDEFRKRGWQPPTSWNDLFRPEFCHYIGLERASQVYSLNAVLMLAQARTDNIDQGIQRFAELSKCTRVLEPAAAKHEEKILLGEYLIGVNSTIRTLPLTQRLPGLKFVLPEEGAIVSATMVSPVKNSPNPVLAQTFIDWFLQPENQKVLMEKLFYSPANTQTAIPAALQDLGIPDQALLNRQPVINDDDFVANRRGWSQTLERAIGSK